MTTLPDLPNVLWLDTYGKYKPEPLLKGDVKVDTAIIGGGFNGLCHFANRTVIPEPPEPLGDCACKGNTRLLTGGRLGLRTPSTKALEQR